MSVVKPRRFQLILIKPSHYDDDGYVIQWFRSFMPSNSLAALYGLAVDAAERRVLGADVAIDITPIDETNTRIKPKEIIAQIKRYDGFGLVGFVGVQSNQFPRALDLARPLRAAGVPVVVGGFHVSGCLSMLRELQADLQIALDMGVSLFAGEAEERLDGLLRDAASGSLKPIYNYLNDLPNIQSAPVPFLLRSHIERTAGNYSTFDAGRGCPYQCSFCTIINVQGRKSRRRSADDVERIIRQNHAEGVGRIFVTDDNLARNKDWELIFDRLIKLRAEEGIGMNLTIQVDTLCHKIPNFIEKAAKAGVKRVFIGLESVNPDTLLAAKKRQNKITEYRKLLLAWKNVGAVTYAGYILGFPNDTPESIARDLTIIQRELPIDVIEFFCLTPLPGSEDHQILWNKGIAMDPDMNKYETEHVVTAHPRMTKEEWEDIYRRAWDIFYTPEHVERIMRRAGATGLNLGSLAGSLLHFSQFTALENVHPLQGGLLRLKYRRDRRPGLPIVPVWLFYPGYLWETAGKVVTALRVLQRLYRLKRIIKNDPQRLSYVDEALTPASDEDFDVMELFNQNDAARNAVQHEQAVRELTRTAAR